MAACVKRGLKVLSATGAGARADPTRIRVADIRESTIDPLSRSVTLLTLPLLKYYLKALIKSIIDDLRVSVHSLLMSYIVLDLSGKTQIEERARH